jgi:NAD(P)-dependent dehydrogenase (short-subunit alcohol dehydrogenase family)
MPARPGARALAGLFVAKGKGDWLMLQGRVAIVTGGARGIGRSHCLELARHGATVVVNDLGGSDAGDPESAEAVVREICESGGAAGVHECSVSSLGAVEAMVEATLGAYGRLDIIVNNAGITRDRTIVSMTESEFDSVIETHLKGTWAVTKAAAMHWRAESKAGRSVCARIINTTSGTGLFGNGGQANYGAAKAGIANLTIISAMELARYGVTANAISPLARTRMTAGLPSMQHRVGSGFDRFNPGNSSPVVAWLASEASGWLTGAVLRVDGGTVSRMIGWQIDPNVRHTAGDACLDPLSLDEGMRRAFGISPPGVPGGIVTRS